MPAIKEILLVPHTHHDIGYTNTPQACLAAHERAIYQVLDLCEREEDDDSPAAFRWTIEISRPLEQFLRRANARDIERLQSLVARKRISVTAGYLHMTQLIGHEDYVRFFSPVREIRERYGLPLSIVQHADVNGLSWGVVQLMQQMGLDCLVMGLNPDHGLPPLEQPSAFWWEGQDGSMIFVWLSSHYGNCDDWGITSGRIEPAIEPIRALVARAEARDDYPFDFLLLHAAQDNMWPNPQAARAARLWNEQGLKPPMRVVTIDMAMERARVCIDDGRPTTDDRPQSTTNSQLLTRNSQPILRGEWSDWWSHGHGSTAYEVGVGREAQANLRVAETLQALARCADPRGNVHVPDAEVPVIAWYRRPSRQVTDPRWHERLDSAYDHLLLFEEHTWGSFDSIRRPFGLFARSHWNGKAAFAYEAENEARTLAREATERLLAALLHSDTPSLAIINPLSTRRDDIALVGTLAGQEAVFAGDLPPLGVKVVPWSGAEPSTQPPDTELGDPVLHTSFENDYYLLEVDPNTASIIRLYDKETGREWVEPDTEVGIGAVIYEEADHRDNHPAVQVDRKYFSPAHPGPRFTRTMAACPGTIYMRQTGVGTTITMESEAPYLPLIRTSITLYGSFKCIDLSVRLDKRENYNIEGVYVAFPFAMQKPEFLMETANAVYSATREQLPNTCRDWYSVQHGIGITDGQAGVLWATRQAPLVQIGELRTGTWDPGYVPSTGHLYAWLMNNLYSTNFKAAQGERTGFDFRFTTSGSAVSPAGVRLWGEAFAFPPIALLADVQPGTYKWLDVRPENVTVQVMKPAHDDSASVTIRVKEIAGRPTKATLSWLGEGTVTLLRTDLLESTPGAAIQGDGKSFHLQVKPYELVTLIMAFGG